MKVIDKQIYQDLKNAEELLLQVLDYLNEDEHKNTMFNPTQNIVQAIKNLPIHHSDETNKYN